MTAGEQQRRRTHAGDGAGPAKRNSGLPPEVRAAVARGLRLFPVKARAKVPLVKAWQKVATNDLAQLEAWARKWPGCNWGMATGRASGVVVIDVDGKLGRSSLADLKRQGLTLPSTLTVSTGRPEGGQHRYYRMPSGGDIRNDESGKIGPQIDVRGIGGYVVIPPSLHESGTQHSVVDPDVPLAEMPAWLIERLTVHPPIPTPATTAPSGKQAVTKGGRTPLLRSLAGTMIQRRMSLEAITAALLAENFATCSPPLPEAKVRRMAADMLQRYAASTTPAPASPFRMTDEGVFWQRNADEPPVKLSAPVDVIAKTRDASGDDWGRLLEWRDMDCPAKSVPAGMRQTGMEGAWDGQGKEIWSGADREPATAD